MLRPDVVIADARSPYRLELASGQQAIFGYGSLLSVTSLERTLGHPYRYPFVICDVEGWRRSWTVAMPNSRIVVDTPDGEVAPERIVYLNVRRSPETMLVGALFTILDTELAAYDEREWIYRRVDVTSALRGIELRGEGRAWMYASLPAYEVSSPADWRQAAIRATYVKIVEDALHALGDDVTARFAASSDTLPRRLVVPDRIRAPG